MADLKTNYVDDVLDTSVNVKRKYNMIQNADGTVSFDDVTTYTQNGDSFGAKDINDTNAAVNELNSNLAKAGEWELLGRYTSKGKFELNKSILEFNYISMITRFEGFTLVVQTLPSLFVGVERYNLYFYNGTIIREASLNFDTNGNLNIITFSNINEVLIIGFN